MTSRLTFRANCRLGASNHGGAVTLRLVFWAKGGPVDSAWSGVPDTAP